MGMFDKETQLKNADFTDGVFMLWEGKYHGKVTHAEYGENTKATVLASPLGKNKDDADEYVVFGVMADQIGRIDNGDLPSRVIITKDGRANVLQKVEE